jgi:hypothetical protein
MDHKRKAGCWNAACGGSGVPPLRRLVTSTLPQRNRPLMLEEALIAPS